jgi:hypothetical protein
LLPGSTLPTASDLHIPQYSPDSECLSSATHGLTYLHEMCPGLPPYPPRKRLCLCVCELVEADVHAADAVTECPSSRRSTPEVLCGIPGALLAQYATDVAASLCGGRKTTVEYLAHGTVSLYSTADDPHAHGGEHILPVLSCPHVSGAQNVRLQYPCSNISPYNTGAWRNLWCHAAHARLWDMSGTEGHLSHHACVRPRSVEPAV